MQHKVHFTKDAVHQKKRTSQHKLWQIHRACHVMICNVNDLTIETQPPPPSKGCKNNRISTHPRDSISSWLYILHPPLPEGSQLPGSPTTLAALQPFMPARNPLVEAPDTCAASTKALTTASDVSSNGTFLARKGWKVRFFHPKKLFLVFFFFGGGPSLHEKATSATVVFP